MSGPKAAEFRARLKALVNNYDETFAQSLSKMSPMRKEAKYLGIDFNAMLREVCQEISAEKKRAGGGR